MARNLDEFANELTQVTVQVIQAANTGAKTRDIVQAHAAGDHAKATRIAESMTTAELQAAKAHLER